MQNKWCKRKKNPSLHENVIKFAPTNFTFNWMYSICKAPSHFFPLYILIPLTSWRNFVCSCLNDVTRTITHTIQKVLFNVYHFHVQICDHLGQDDSTTAWLLQSPAATSVSSHTRSSNHPQQQSLTSHTRSSNYQQQSLHHTPEAWRKLHYFTYFYLSTSVKASAMNL